MTITMAKRVRAPAMGATTLPMAAPAALLAMLWAPHAGAEIKVTPAVDLRATYSDNVSLTSDELARGQFVTELSPSVAIVSNTPRLKLHARAAVHMYAYSGERVSGTNSSSRDLSADARANLIDELLYFDGNATIGQRSVSAFGPQSGNGYSDAKRDEVRTWRASPYLRRRFGNLASAEARYTRDSVQTSNAAFGNSTSNTAAVTLASGPTFRTVGWGFQASRQEIDDSLRGDSRVDTSALNLRLRVTNEFSLKASGGYDRYDYDGEGGETAGSSRSVGFIWTPSLRTSIDASIGKRFYGDSYSLSALHRSRNTTWNITYNDAVTTAREQFLLPAPITTFSILERLFIATYPDPVERRLAVEAYMRATGVPIVQGQATNVLTNRFLLQKTLQASVGLIGSRSSAILSFNATERTALSPQRADSALLPPSLPSLNDDLRTVGATLAATYRLSPRSNVNASLGKTRTESLTTGFTGDQSLMSLALTRQFQRSIRGIVEVRHQRGTAAIPGGNEYRENSISASLSYQL
ncbi:TIGR03016 family PEP-CTERM system-associated outer membrane protein [Massilia eurypsychrophila]|nr:TIGR03016 family PEP-CTERM system-associated outer membrane protein [Massilia eurypsychrophila]